VIIFEIGTPLKLLPGNNLRVREGGLRALVAAVSTARHQE
jgi:hypothetical protein